MWMRIVWLAADLQGEWNTSAFRVMIPNEMMKRAGHHSFVGHVGEIIDKPRPETVQEIDEADVIVIERLPIKETHEFIAKMRQRHKQVWVTFDDHYGLMPITSASSYRAWRGGKEARNGNGALLNEFREGLGLATGFMTPSKLLCEDFRRYNARAEYVPNYLDSNLWKNTSDFVHDVWTIGYGGTSLHNISIKDSGIIFAFGKLCKRDLKVQVYLQPAFPDIIEMFKRAGVRYQTGDWMPVERWPAVVSQFSVGVAPLSGNYDFRRSNLKVLEYASVGVPWVATEAAPYLEARGGILVSNRSDEWYFALKELRENKSLYQKLSQEGLAWAAAHNADCARRYEEVFGVSQVS
jgi:glycosyltransferase involved in cell wall biosynthesis